MIPPPVLQERALETLQVCDAKHRGKQVAGMIFRHRFLLILLLFVFFAAVSSTVVAWAQADQNSRKVSLRLDRLVNELDMIEQEQEKILKRQDEIIETIKNLKIWARR